MRVPTRLERVLVEFVGEMPGADAAPSISDMIASNQSVASSDKQRPEPS